MSTIEQILEKKQTQENLREKIVDYIIDDNMEFRNISKNSNASFIVKNIENIKIEYDGDIDKYYIEVPYNYHDRDMDKIVLGSLSLIERIKEHNEEKYSEEDITDFFAENPEYLDENIKYESFEKFVSTAEPKPSKKPKSEEGKGEEESSSSESSEGAGGHGYSDSEEEIRVADYNRETRMQEADATISHKVRTKNSEKFYGNAEVDEIYKKISKQLLKYFEGKNNRISTSNPSARLNKRINDSSENIYMTKQTSGGKFIENITFIIDGSGSMSGQPTMNARILVEAFSELARNGYCTGDVIISKGSGSYHAKLNTKDLKNYIHGDSGSEGIEKTMKEHLEILKKSSAVFCITDGCITDNPIDKNFYNKQRIQTVGIYVNSAAVNPEEYNGRLKQWFDYSICRPNIEDCVNTIVQLGLRNRR